MSTVLLQVVEVRVTKEEEHESGGGAARATDSWRSGHECNRHGSLLVAPKADLEVVAAAPGSSSKDRDENDISADDATLG